MADTAPADRAPAPAAVSEDTPNAVAMPAPEAAPANTPAEGGDAAEPVPAQGAPAAASVPASGRGMEPVSGSHATDAEHAAVTPMASVVTPVVTPPPAAVASSVMPVVAAAPAAAQSEDVPAATTAPTPAAHAAASAEVEASAEDLAEQTPVSPAESDEPRPPSGNPG